MNKRKSIMYLIFLTSVAISGCTSLFSAALQDPPAVTDMEMVLIPAGEFLMGSDQHDPNERPQRAVYLDAFWIDQTEVTNAQYAQCMAEGACRTQRDPKYVTDKEKANHPVVYVTWEEAQAFCQWAGKTLPTEAQWEKAARGTDGRLFPWGNQAPSRKLLNYYDHRGGTTPVGSYPAGVSPYGLLDMAGNASEWVSDWYDPTYYQRAPDRNPPGPEDESVHVKRGGSWFTLGDLAVRVSFRKYTGSEERDYNIGFRCVYNGK